MLRSVIVAMPAQGFAPRPRRLPRASAQQLTTGPQARGTVDEDASDAANEPAASQMDGPESAEIAVPTRAPAVFGPTATRAAAGPQPPVPASVVRPAPPMPRANPDPVAVEIATRLADSVRKIYGDSVRGVYLYGARAAGMGQANSDVETIVVLDRVEHYGAELERTSHVCSELSHELKLVVSRVFVAEADWNDRSAAESIRREAVPV
jgi:hypothetical protein